MPTLNGPRSKMSSMEIIRLHAWLREKQDELSQSTRTEVCQRIEDELNILLSKETLSNRIKEWDLPIRFGSEVSINHIANTHKLDELTTRLDDLTEVVLKICKKLNIDPN